MYIGSERASTAVEAPFMGMRKNVRPEAIKLINRVIRLVAPFSATY